MWLEKIVDGVGNFLKFGPIGFSAFIFVIVIIALTAGRRTPADRDFLRLIVWVGFAVYLVAAILAVVPEFNKPAVTVEQAQEINLAMQKASIVVTELRRIPGLMSSSCSGGASGVNPANYGELNELVSGASTAVSEIQAVLNNALKLAPPSISAR